MSESRFDGSQYQVKVVTPQGEAEWCSLKTPKQWKNEEKRNFLSTVIVSKEEAQPIMDDCDGMIEKIKDMMDKNPKLSPHDPYKILDDGRVALKFKRPAFVANDKYPATPPITTYMPNGERVDWDSTAWSVGNGSVISIGGYIRPYYVPMLGLGISLRLEAVKIHDLKEYVAGGGESFSDDFGNSATTMPVADVNGDAATMSLEAAFEDDAKDF